MRWWNATVRAAPAASTGFQRAFPFMMEMLQDLPNIVAEGSLDGRDLLPRKLKEGPQGAGQRGEFPEPFHPACGRQRVGHLHRTRPLNPFPRLRAGLRDGQFKLPEDLGKKESKAWGGLTLETQRTFLSRSGARSR